MDIEWTDYLRVHSDRRNLIIHVVAVPLFVGGFICIASYLVRADYISAAIAAALAFFAMVLQKRGHDKEQETPLPFTSFPNFLRRWFHEQFIIFPLFVLSGRWWRQYRAGDDSPENDA